MKRILRNLFRSVEQKNKQQLINELLTLDNTIEESVLLFEKVKADFLFRLSQKQEQLKKETELIEQLKSDTKERRVVFNLEDVEVFEAEHLNYKPTTR